MNLKRSFTLAVVFLFAVTLPSLSGCSNYGPVSDRAYDVAKALYSACNTESVDRVEKIQTMLEDEKDNEAMSGQEIKWLENIIKKTKSNQWDAAAANARQMMVDQVKY